MTKEYDKYRANYLDCVEVQMLLVELQLSKEPNLQRRPETALGQIKVGTLLLSPIG